MIFSPYLSSDGCSMLGRCYRTVPGTWYLIEGGWMVVNTFELLYRDAVFVCVLSSKVLFNSGAAAGRPAAELTTTKDLKGNKVCPLLFF